MRRRRFRALPPGLLILGIVATTLVGIIGLELREGALGEGPVPVALTRQQSEGPPVSASGNVPGNQTARNVAAILARPLFSPSRRPDDVAANGTATGLARLTGVMVSPAGKSAIFAGSAGGKPVVVGEGTRIGEYVIGSIDVGTVTIIGPGGQRVLHPAFDPSPPPKAGVPAPTVAPIIVGPGSAAPVVKPLPMK